MKVLSFLIVMMFSYGVFAHCPADLGPTNLCADIEWLDGPSYGRLSAFRVKFWQKGDLSHDLIEPKETLELMSYMYMDNGHHHGGPGMTWVKVEDGLYEVKDARFMKMKGKWVIFVKLLDENKALVAKDSLPVEFIAEAEDSSVGSQSDH